MDAPSHSVYNIEGRATRFPGAAPSPASVPEDDWSEGQRRLHRQTLGIVFVAIMAWLLIAACALYYARRLDARRRVGHLVQQAMDRSASPFRYDLDARTTCLVDNPEPAPIPGDVRERPVSASSVKQAAYYLSRAQQAARQQRYEAALGGFQNALRIFPDIRGVQAQIATMAMHLKRFELAAEAYEKASQEGPLTVSMANGLGIACMRIGDLDRAERAFQAALRADPKRAGTFQNLSTLYLKRGQPEKAIRYLENYLFIRPGDTMATQAYALLLIRLQQWDRAAGLLLQIIRKSPDVAPVYFQLAQALSHMNQREAAIMALNKAARLMDPQQALDRLSRPEFDLLRNEPAFGKLLRELGAKE